MDKKIIVLIFGVLLVSSISASFMNVKFFHSDSCGYCQKIKPFVEEKVNELPNYKWEKYEITSNEDNYNHYKEYNFEGVPAFVINTPDGREVKFSGANEIRLGCELNEMSTKGCLTHSADNCIGGSWFLE